MIGSCEDESGSTDMLIFIDFTLEVVATADNTSDSNSSARIISLSRRAQSHQNSSVNEGATSEEVSDVELRATMLGYEAKILQLEATVAELTGSRDTWKKAALRIQRQLYEK